MQAGIFERYGLFIGIASVLAVASLMYWMRNEMILERLEGSMTVRFQTISKYQDNVYLPKVNLAGPNGKIVNLKDFKGDYLILNVWGTWCTPCIEDLPRLERLRRHYLGKEWNVVAVSVDPSSDIDKLIAYIEKYRFGNVAYYHDYQGALQKALPMKSLPVTYIVNKRGRIVYEVAGEALWDAPDVIEFLDYVAKVK